MKALLSKMLNILQMYFTLQFFQQIDEFDYFEKNADKFFQLLKFQAHEKAAKKAHSLILKYEDSVQK
jgi:hypothetical protein